MNKYDLSTLSTLFFGLIIGAALFYTIIKDKRNKDNDRHFRG